MTLEEAVQIAEGWAYLDADSAKAAQCLMAVARAFPKMLSALEAASEDHELHCSGDQSAQGCGLRDEMRDALRAAREALGPVTPPQRCTDTVTAWLDEGDQTVERENTCGHVLPCPLHTPRAAREAVKP